MTSEISIIKKSEAFVKSIFDRHEQTLHYHNWEHTLEVRRYAMQIAEMDGSLNSEELEVLELAAIFHDVAYYKGKECHEEHSSELMKEFLLDQGVSSEKIAHIDQTIMATMLSNEPVDLLGKIIRDADLSGIGRKDYFDNTFSKLFQEINLECNPKLKQQDWVSMCIEFIGNHEYHTPQAKTLFDDQKQLILQSLREMQENEEIVEAVQEESVEEKPKKKKGKKDKKKNENKPEKGIETMFRISLRNHMTLSQIADNKANTLISVNGIIISIVLSAMVPKMDSNPYIIVPGLVLLVFSIVTIIIAILSTIPKTTHGKVSKDAVAQGKGNLLFFGNFHQMSLDEYESGVDALMNDKEYLYKSLTRDLYFLGKVLNKKYSLLRYSYYIFVTGLLVTIALFMINVQSITT